MSDKIEKSIFLKASPSKVWLALTDYREFGTWFRVKLEGPFVLGQITSGQITFPGYEHIRFQAQVQKMEPERLFSFTWPHTTKTDPNAKGSNGPTTLVEFSLEKVEGGTRLVVIESGFESIPADERIDIFRGNEEGWVIQMSNIEAFLDQKS